jgi:alpha-1,3-glucan synthase
MPGWWYTVESITPKHLVHQFKMAIHEALGSSEKTRSMMRARSAKQRFPVAQWVEDLDTLQTESIKISREENYEKSHSLANTLKSPSMTNLRTLFAGGHGNGSQPDLPPPFSNRHGSSLALPGTPGSASAPWTAQSARSSSYSAVDPWKPPGLEKETALPSPNLRDLQVYTPSPVGSPAPEDVLLPPSLSFARDSDSMRSRRFSTLSYDSVAGGREDFALQKVDPAFTDASGMYLKEFEKKLEHLGAKSSENLLCIEENLMKSEKNFFKDYREAKMGISTPKNSSRAPSLMGSRPVTPVGSFFEHSAHGSVDSIPHENLLNEFPLGAGYKPPTGLSLWLLYRVGDWPVYSILLALGQIISANSYQITLLIGEVGETALQLYVIATIYAVSSIGWWLLFRRLKSVYCLSIPFILYGAAFLCIGLAPFFGSFARGVSSLFVRDFGDDG